MSAPPLLALAFLAPAFLGALALVGVPILIHLLARRQFRQVEWGAMRFLLEAERENRRRVRFEQWLLLALRCLALGLLALVFARPFVQPGLVGRLLGGAQPRPRVVVLDDSASLGYQVGTRSEFVVVQQTADRLLTWLRDVAPDDRILVYRASTPETPVVDVQAAGDAGAIDAAVAAVKKLTVTDLSARPAAVLRVVAEQLAAAALRAADVYIISDGQRSDWFADSADSAFAPLIAAQNSSEGDERPSLRLYFMLTGSEPRPNLAVQSIALERPQTVAGQPAVVRVTLANFGVPEVRDVSLNLSLDEQPLPPVAVESVPPGETTSVTAEVTFPAPGPRVLAASCSGRDAMPADDQARAVTPVVASLRVLLVNGAPSRVPLEDETYLLSYALAPPGPLSAGIEVETIDAAELEAVPLEQFAVVFLCNVAPPAEATIRALERFVAGGGGLFLSVGDAIGPLDAYNRAWFDDGRGVLPVALGDFQAADESAVGVKLRRVQNHSLTALFPDESELLSDYVNFRAYFTTVHSTDAGAQLQGLRGPVEILARYNDEAGHIALATCTYGAGRVVQFTSTLDLDWNDWARAVDGSFVVTMLETVQFLAPRPRAPLAYAAGSVLTFQVPPEQFEAGALFKPPGFPAVPAVPATIAQRDVAPGEWLTLKGPVAAQRGLYELELTNRLGKTDARPLAVNLVPAESDLARATRAELRAAAGLLPLEIIDARDSFLADAEKPRRELWRGLLYAAIAILMAEQGLAWWFGGGRQLWRRGGLRALTGAVRGEGRA